MEVVRHLLEHMSIRRAARDSFGNTPFLLAAQYRQNHILDLLAPFNDLECLSEDALAASSSFTATVSACFFVN